MSNMNLQPPMNTDKHGLKHQSRFMEKLLDGVEVEWKKLGELAKY